MWWMWCESYYTGALGTVLTAYRSTSILVLHPHHAIPQDPAPHRHRLLHGSCGQYSVLLIYCNNTREPGWCQTLVILSLSHNKYCWCCYCYCYWHCYCYCYCYCHPSTPHVTEQYSTVQYSTVQYSTVQYSTVQYSSVQYSTVICLCRMILTPKKVNFDLQRVNLWPLNLPLKVKFWP